jgi:hypothetical protein
MSSKKPSAHRTFGIYVLAIIAGYAGVVAVFDTLRYLGLLPAGTFGTMEFYGQSWIGAFFAGLLAFIWFLTMWQIWNLDPRGWMFMVVVAVINLVFILIAWIGSASFAQVAPMLFVSGLALIIGVLPKTKEQFGVK